MDVCNIINLGHRWQRRISVAAEMEAQNALYMFFLGVEGDTPKINIHHAHKQIIRHAKEYNYPRVIVAEDDCVFTAPDAWKFFLDNIPQDYDLYVASYYSGSHDENFVVTGFRGLTLYSCHQRFYEKFLSLSESLHLDSAIAMSDAKVIVSPLFCATQAAGYSDQRKKIVDDSNRLKNKAIYTGQRP